VKEKLETRGTVLIIDDDVLPMMFYVWALEKEGFKVRQCYGPDTALEFVEKEGANIALLILDIMMLPGKRYRDEDMDEGVQKKP